MKIVAEMYVSHSPLVGKFRTVRVRSRVYDYDPAA